MKVKSNMGRAGALEVPSKEAKRHTKHRRPDGTETKGTREKEKEKAGHARTILA